MKSRILAQLVNDLQRSIDHVREHYTAVMSDLWRDQPPNEHAVDKLRDGAIDAEIAARDLQLYINDSTKA